MSSKLNLHTTYPSQNLYENRFSEQLRELYIKAHEATLTLKEISKTPFKQTEIRGLYQKINPLVDFACQFKERVDSVLLAKRSVDFRRIQYLDPAHLRQSEADEVSPLFSELSLGLPLAHNKKLENSRTLSYLCLEERKSDPTQHPFYCLPRKTINYAFSFFKAPLSNVLDNNGRLFRDTDHPFHFPSKTYCFFHQTLKGTPFQKTSKNLPNGSCSGSITSLSLDNLRFIKKAETLEEATSKGKSGLIVFETIEYQKNLLKIEAAAYVGLKHPIFHKIKPTSINTTFNKLRLVWPHLFKEKLETKAAEICRREYVESLTKKPHRINRLFEGLEKPLLDEKCKNILQHPIQKVFFNNSSKTA